MGSTQTIASDIAGVLTGLGHVVNLTALEQLAIANYSGGIGGILTAISDNLGLVVPGASPLDIVLAQQVLAFAQKVVGHAS